MSSFFSNLKDEEFYSPTKLTHIYLNGEVDSKKVEKLFVDVQKANQLKEKKPILIHISSIGGSLQDGMRLLSIFKTSKLPIATIVDNYCFSIATLLLINSPYRIVTDNSYCLIHEYKITGYINEERGKLLNFISKLDAYFKTIVALYLKKTTFQKEELEELLKHNLLIDAKSCIKKGIADRLIKNNHKQKEMISGISKLLKGTDATILTISCNMTNEIIDKMIMNVDDKLPCVIYTIFSNCATKKDNSIGQLTSVLSSLNLISKISAIPTYKTAVIDVPITIENLLPLLFTDRIYMYDHTYIIVNYPLINISSDHLLLEDSVKNTNLIIERFKEVLKEKTKMSHKQIEDINKKFMVINAKQAKALGLCYEIIKS